MDIIWHTYLYTRAIFLAQLVIVSFHDDREYLHCFRHGEEEPLLSNKIHKTATLKFLNYSTARVGESNLCIDNKIFRNSPCSDITKTYSAGKT